MTSELQRQRVQQFQQQRERYLYARQRASQQTLSPNRRLLTTRHPHLPLLLAIPFAILTVAGALDLLCLLTGSSTWSSLSFAMIPAGVVGSVAAAIVGMHDWFAVQAGSRVRGIGAMFAIGTAIVVVIFAQSWVARFGFSGDVGGVGVILGFMGAAIALLTGWLLGEYLERLAALKPAAELPQIERVTPTHRIEEVIEQRHVAHA